jgi:hypothetical protein
MLVALLALALPLQDVSEAQARDTFTREFKDKSVQARDVAVRRLVGLKEEKTLQLLAGALKDPEGSIRKSAVEVILTCTDSAGAAIRSICGILLNKREDKELRALCARVLAKAEYKAEPIDALIQTISGIGEQDKDLFAFGAECSKILGQLAGQDFGAGKETPDKWKAWWKDNKAKVTKEDQEKLAAYKKSAAKSK